MTQGSVLLTKAGLAKLEAELKELRTTGRAAVAETIREAQSLGTAEIDGQYEDAKNQQAFLEGRIQELEKMLEDPEIIDEAEAHKSKAVRIGSTVTLKLGNGTKQVFQLVGPAEASPSDGRISHESPVGRALLGSKRNDKVKVSAPGGETTMTVVSVR
ncbi:MAG: transcription elongation factor GreA [Chloroflexi bacterium]|nr:transcription elongation factor GreA [Chloroflexota bacterium]